MSRPRDQEVVDKARQLLIRLWGMRDQIWLDPPTVEDLFPLQPEIIIKDVHGVNYEEPVDIPPLPSLKQEVVNTQTAGFIDRDANKIVVVQKFRPEYRRFTAAHEIGHWILHPAVKYRRERPLNGGEGVSPHRPEEERQADVFAAELLMPRKILHGYFYSHFGECIDGRNPSEELAFWLSAGVGREIDLIELAKEGAGQRAFLIAKLSSFKGRHFVSLADRFGVSPTAMGIQLERLGLVK